jgi:polysaccharide export outer membrane protein
VLAINVWKEPEISRAVPVRLDGAISLPLVGEVHAAGRTPLQLEQEITKKLETYISEPQVTVIVQEMRSKRFNVLGQVARPGSYLLSNSTTVLDAIALAGGFRDFAKQKDIYVLRRNPDGSELRLPFNYKDVIKGKNTDQNVKLQPEDSVYVP